jgi:ATP-dependent protease ClpP protease subunit
MSETAYIAFNGEVNAATVERLLATLARVTGEGSSAICILLSTSGGSITKALTVYNTLMALPVELTTYNVGSVNSIGNLIFLAGHKRYACPGSTFMFHGIGVDLKSPVRLVEAELIEKIEAVRFHQALVARIISERTSMPLAAARRMFSREKFLAPDEARRLGIIHKIQHPKMPRGAKYTQL